MNTQDIAKLEDFMADEVLDDVDQLIDCFRQMESTLQAFKLRLLAVDLRRSHGR